MAVLRIVLLALFAASAATAAIPYGSSPSWQSRDRDYSTGGSLCDVNGDGRLDFVVSNGNDMDNDYNAVYLNLGDTLESVASWRSTDAGYYGHCYTGDVTGDGRPDLAVAYLGRGLSGDHLARIYRNTGTAFEATPGWQAADRHSSFDCALGDFDLDGDLDLAISGGDVYTNSRDLAHIYRNESGVLDTLPFWRSADSMYADAIRFCDIDNDGDLDLFIGRFLEVAMYENHSGVLDSAPSWMAQTDVGWVLRLAFGDYDNDGFLDLAAASNSQRGGINNVKVFHNDAGTLDTLAIFTLLENETYSSCVAWGDVNGDGFPELAAGGWWDPVVVFENDSGTLGTTPAWQWLPADPSRLVCETVAFGDLQGRYLESVADSATGDGGRSLFSIGPGPVHALDSVAVDGARVPTGAYCWDALGGWFSLAQAPAPNAHICWWYRRASRLDLAVANWDTVPTTRNVLFLNTDPSGLSGREALVLARIEARPSPATGPVTFRLAPARPDAGPLDIYTRDGRLIRKLDESDGGWRWDLADATGRAVAPGIYFAHGADARVKVVVAR